MLRSALFDATATLLFVGALIDLALVGLIPDPALAVLMLAAIAEFASGFIDDIRE